MLDALESHPEDLGEPGPAEEASPESFNGIPENTWGDYRGPRDRLPRPFPLTQAVAHGSLTDQAAATATANAWSLVAYERQRWAHANFGQLAPSLSNADAARLHGVQTDGPRGYLWTICDEEDLAAYIAAGLPVWGTILGAPACVVLQGDVQGMPGAGEFGHAAERIGRLIRFRNV